MQVLYLTDRLSDRGGADQHLAQMVAATTAAGHRAVVAFGRNEGGSILPADVVRRRVAGLANRVASSAKLGGLDELLADADVVHLQNVMNPVVLERVAAHPRTLVTVQDHRVFCPGPGKTMPDGRVCTNTMSEGVCRECLPDGEYRRATLDLTRRRLDAVRAMQVVALSRYMAVELEAVGVEDVRVIPPWVEPGAQRTEAGSSILLGGRLVPHKGVPDAWSAWEQAGRPLPLEVAGAGSLQAELTGAAHLGWLSGEALRQTLRRSRMLVFPARWQEPFGILGLEALAEGTPVVVAACGGTEDWSGAGCIRVARGAVNAMASAVASLAADPGAALALGREGQAAVAERFSRDRISSELASLYRKILES